MSGSGGPSSVEPTRTGQVRSAAALGSTLLVAVFPQFGIGALGPQLRDDLGLGPTDIGLLYLALYVIGVIGSPVAGAIVDRIGGRRSCLGLVIVAAASLTVAGLAQDRTQLMVALVPMGAAMAFANPATNRWAAETHDPRQQALLVGIAQAGVQAGALAAGVLAAAAAMGLDWRRALFVIAIIGLCAAVLIAADARSVRRTPTPSPTTTSSPTDAVFGLEGEVQDPPRQVPIGARRLAAYALTMGAGTAIVVAYLATYAADVLGATPSVAGGTAIVFGATALLCRVLLGVNIRRPDEQLRPWLTVLAVGAIASVAVIAAAPWWPPAVWVGAVLFGATGTTWPALAYLGVVRAATPATAGVVTGWVTAAFYLGLWLSPVIGGLVIETVGYPAAWALAAVWYLLAILPVHARRSPDGPASRDTRRRRRARRST